MNVTSTMLAEGIANCLTAEQLEQLCENLLDGLMAADPIQDNPIRCTKKERRGLDAVSQLHDELCIANRTIGENR